MEHGIQIWTDGEWFYIPATDRNQAEALHEATLTRDVNALCRRVLMTDEGVIVPTQTTA